MTVGPYVQLVSTDSIRMVWWSENDTPGTLEWGLSDSYGERVSSAHEAFDHVPGFRHEVQLMGLQSNMRHFYRVVQDGSTEAAHFTTAVELGTDFTFAVAADPESKATEPVRNITQRAVLDQIATYAPRFLLYAGDLVDQGNAQDDWDAFWPDMAGFAATTPVYPALGNHDNDGLDTTLRGNRVAHAQPYAEAGVANVRDLEENPEWQEGFSRFIYPEGNRRHGYVGVCIEHQGGSAYRATITPYYLDPDTPNDANRHYDDVIVLQGSIP